MYYDTLEDIYYGGDYSVCGSQYAKGGSAVGATFDPIAGRSVIQKATDAFDIGETQFIDPYYSAAVSEWVLRTDNAYRLPARTTFASRGDSFKAISADPGSDTDVCEGVDASDAIFDTQDTFDITDVIGGNSVGIKARIIQAHWTIDLDFKNKMTYQYDPKFTPENIRGLMTKYYLYRMDVMLTTNVDTTAGKNLESLDRIASGYEESTTESGYTSTDFDLFGQDRHSAATGMDAALDVSATARSLTLDQIDDILAEMAPYVDGDVWSLTHPQLLNRWEKLMEAKQQFLGQGNVSVTKNGVQTRKGEEGGFQVAKFRGGGIADIPIFTDTNVTQPHSSKGNLYFFDNDHLEMRMAIPQTYAETPDNSYPLIGTNGAFETRYLLYNAGQLIADKYKCHGKISSVQ
jgi:hypothetical protein